MNVRVQTTANIPDRKRGLTASKAKKPAFSPSTTTPVEQILYLQQTVGNQAVQRLLKSGVIQANLKIAQPKNIYEEEAGTPNLTSSIKSLKGSDQSLPKSVRNYFEPRFGSNFSEVRVHTDSKATETARSINAKAFTKGEDVIFGADQYSPETKAGQRLLAHELAHVAQQSRSLGASALENSAAYDSSGAGTIIQRTQTERYRYPIPIRPLSPMQRLMRRYPPSRLLPSLPASSCKGLSGGFTVVLSPGFTVNRTFIKGGSWLDIVNFDNVTHSIMIDRWMSTRPRPTPKSTGSKSRPTPKSTGSKSRPRLRSTSKSTGSKSPSKSVKSTTSRFSIFYVLSARILRVNIASVPKPRTGLIFDYPSRSWMRVTVCP